MAQAESTRRRTEKPDALTHFSPIQMAGMLSIEAVVLVGLLLSWVGGWTWLHHAFPRGLIGGAFPIIATWAGALGGVVNAARGLGRYWSEYAKPDTDANASDYLAHRRQWNAWLALQAPLGAAYGSIAIILIALLLGVVGTEATGALDLSPTGRLTFTAIAFIVGYQQRIFHDLITRTVQIIFSPDQQAEKPTSDFTIDSSVLAFTAAPNGSDTKAITVRNTGTRLLHFRDPDAKLDGAILRFTRTLPPAIGPDQAGQVAVTFSPGADANPATGELVLTAGSVSHPIKLTGTVDNGNAV